MKRKMNAAGRAILALHCGLYRLTGGIVGGRLFNAPNLLLTTTGRKSGKKRTRPLLFLRDGEAFVVVASYAGSDSHPAWFLNLMNQPVSTVQIGREKFPVKPELASAEDKSRLWPKVVEMYPSYATYQKRTDRDIPVVILRRA